MTRKGKKGALVWRTRALHGSGGNVGGLDQRGTLIALRREGEGGRAR